MYLILKKLIENVENNLRNSASESIINNKQYCYNFFTISFILNNNKILQQEKKNQIWTSSTKYYRNI